MKKFKVAWTEDVLQECTGIIEADSLEEAEGILAHGELMDQIFIEYSAVIFEIKDTYEAAIIGEVTDEKV